MKKLFLLIPVGLLATTGLLWMNADYSVNPKSAEASIEKLPENSVKLFSLSEHAVRRLAASARAVLQSRADLRLDRNGSEIGRAHV